jgi:hypothetical protein
MFSAIYVKRAALPALVFAASTGFQLFFFDRWLSAMDEGHVLLYADLLNRGGLLYRDATSYPLPGAFYLLAQVFRLFEPSILVSRWLVSLEFAAFATLGFCLLRRLLPTPWALSGVLVAWLYRAWAFPHWQIFNYSTSALLLLTASLWLLMRHLESGRRGPLVAAGFAFGLGVFCKQDYGAAALLATIATLAAQARAGALPFWRGLGAFLLPAAAVGAAAGLLFLAQGQLGLVIQQTVLNHFVGMSRYDYPGLPSLFPLFRQDPALRELGSVHQWVPALVVAAGPDWKLLLESPLYTRTALYDTAVKAFVYGPGLLLALLGWRQWRLRPRLREPVSRGRGLCELALFHFAAACLLLAWLYRPADYLHLAVLYLPLAWLALPWLHAALARRPRALALLALLALAPACAATAWLLASLRAQHPAPIPGPRAGVYAKEGQARMFGEIVDYVQAHSARDERVAALPYLPIALFLAERLAPHPASYIVWPFPEYPDRDRRIIDALEAQQTSLVLYHFTQFPNLPPMHESAPELYAHLVERYEMGRVFSDELLGQRVAALHRAPPPPGEPLLRDAGEGQLWLESYDGSRKRVAGRRREDFAQRAVWPFRPVLALRPVPYGARNVLALRRRVPPGGARLASAVGVHPDAWFQLPTSATTFEVRVRDGEASALLFARTLDPQRALADRGWFEFELDLAPYAGREVVLELSTAASEPSGSSLAMGGFAEPRWIAP